MFTQYFNDNNNNDAAQSAGRLLFGWNKHKLT